jgi:transposase
MAWTEVTRPKYRRDGLRYASDTADEEWALIEPHLPPPASRGRTRETSLRDVVNAIHHIAGSGCQWRLLRKDFPPHSTVQRYFHAWRDNGLWQIINHVRLMAVREDAGREASPTGSVIDSRSVKTTESGGPRGYDAGKKIKGRKRHIPTDTIGLPLGMIVHPADVQDRDGAPGLRASVRSLYPWLSHVFADRGHAGNKLKDALKKPRRLDARDRQTLGRGPGLCSAAPPLGDAAQGSARASAWHGRQGRRARLCLVER